MSELTQHMPVNYHARYRGVFTKFLDVLDNIEDNQRVRRPISHAIRVSDNPEIMEWLLWRVIVNAYRSGLIP